MLHIADYHLQWLCVHSLCYQKIKWILRRLCFTVRFDFLLQERFLNSWAIALALQTSFGSTKAKQREVWTSLPGLSCQIAHLDWVERALSLLTYGMNYGQIKCFLLDLMQQSSAYRGNADLVTISALCASLALRWLLMTQPQSLVRSAAQSYSLFIHLL